MNIILIYQQMPFHVRALTHKNDDGSYTIIINKNISTERQKEAVLHELTHIEGNDFSAESQATLLEEMVRRNNKGCDLGKFNFFYQYVSA